MTITNRKKVAILGAGFSGLSAACYAAKKGYEVHIYEKHDIAGGRARKFETENGFTFDMGPSWYWMPDIFENFFADFGYTSSDFYKLQALNPQFEIKFDKESICIPDSYDKLKELFENIEIGAGSKLDNFMKLGEEKYKIAMSDFIFKPCLKITEFTTLSLLKNATKLDITTNFSSYVKKFFKDSKLRTIMEFPVIFLGATPREIPAMYSLMNYGGYYLKTWHPIGGFYEVILAMQKIAENLGVSFHFNHNVDKIDQTDINKPFITINKEELHFDEIISSIDYHHTEKLLPPTLRNYNEKYWKKKTFAPSCLIFYLGIEGKLDRLKHHTLFFEEDLDQHIDEIYKQNIWPTKPLFYVCTPSKTDNTVAPENAENLFILMPLGIDMEDTEILREHYFDILIKRIENHCDIQHLKNRIIYKKSYCINDFKMDYNAYGGNAYGLANTLNQTAFFKPKIKNKKVKHLHYTGQLTIPGPGVPPSIISGKIVASLI